MFDQYMQKLSTVSSSSLMFTAQDCLQRTPTDTDNPYPCAVHNKHAKASG